LKRKIYFLKLIFILLWGFFNFDVPLLAETPKQQLKTLKPYRVEKELKIDGKLDEAVWQKPALVDDIFITYNPTDGEVLPKKTKVWLAYDPDNLYFAFYCYDEEPDKIKTSITKRDNLFNDDWVGLGLDPLGNSQCLYELFINPSGMQGDLYSTPTTGENSAPDWVWFSGGQIVKDGYTVEVKLPLKSIRFKHGKNSTMNILFWRRISRLGVSGAWPMIDPGKGIHNSTNKTVYGELKKQLLLEFIPTFTYGSIWDREDPENWSNADDKPEIGISAKYGITSKIIAEMTINPDFSQVESDTFQVLRNQRYPIFYSEKRPFFMEASDLFDLTGSHENLWTAVHTRNIVDPAWGLRLTGDISKFTFGLLGAADNWPGREIEDEENFYLDKQAYYGIGRVKYSINGDSYIGMLFTDKEMGDYHNRVVALDSNYRFGKYHTIKASFMYTDTNDPEEEDSYSGNAYTARYSYSTKKFFGMLSLDKFESNFQMDTAYYQRTGISSAFLYLSPILSVKTEKFDWIKSIRPVVAGKYLYDHGTDMEDRYFNLGVQWNFIKQGYLTLAWDVVDDESWEGVTYDTSGFWGNFGMQFTKWLNFHICSNWDNYIYYDDEDPFLGKRLRIHTAINFQPINTLSFYFSYEFTNFDKKSTGEDVYDYHIFYLRSTYQPNKHLLFRALIQYDSYLDLVMSDILASYEFVPGTVFHIGYGSLHEKLFWDRNSREWLNDVEGRRFYHQSQSFFVKISYRIQF